MRPEQARALMIHKICFKILRKRLEQMRVYVLTLKEMPDDMLFEEYRKQIED